MKKKTSPASKGKLDAAHFVLAAAFVLLLTFVLGGGAKNLLGSGGFDTSKKIIRSEGQTFVSVKNLEDEFKVELEAGNEFAIFDDKTWIPVQGSPVEVIVVNDPECGATCNTARQVSTLRQVLTPALLVRTVDVGSEEGKELREMFEMVSVPSFVIGDGVEDLKRGEMKVLDQIKQFIVEKEGKYLVEASKVGFPIGKYIEAPKFDIADEPSQGNGKVKVIEFADYQCPYCKRLHDQNKDLIAELVEEGKIEYVIKDFPLGFHKEAMAAHLSANCVQKLSGDDAHWEMNAEIFAHQQKWSGKANAEEILKGLAVGIGVDAAGLDECMADESMKEEVNADMAEGQKFGVTGTPSLFIGKQRMPGAIGPDAFKKAVEDES